MVARDVLNSSMKGFADIWRLAQHSDFDKKTLVDAVANTFRHRQTVLPANPVAFSGELAQRDDKQV